MFTNELKAYFIARMHCIHAIMLHHIGATVRKLLLEKLEITL